MPVFCVDSEGGAAVDEDGPDISCVEVIAVVEGGAVVDEDGLNNI